MTSVNPLHPVFTANQRPATRQTDNPDGTVTLEWAAINSVELVNTIKDGLRVASVKVYALNPMEAARIAVETAIYAEKLVREARGDSA